MEYLLFVFGLLIGLIVSSLFHRMKTATGTLKVDHSNPEKDSYLICIDRFDDLRKKKRIMLKVDHHADLSQK